MKLTTKQKLSFSKALLLRLLNEHLITGQEYNDILLKLERIYKE